MSDGSELIVLVQDIGLLVADVLGLDGVLVGADTGPATEPAWDSLAHLSIVTAVEQKYRVRFAMDEIRAVENVGDLAKMVSGRRAG